MANAKIYIDIEAKLTPETSANFTKISDIAKNLGKQFDPLNNALSETEEAFLGINESVSGTISSIADLKNANVAKSFVSATIDANKLAGAIKAVDKEISNSIKDIDKEKDAFKRLSESAKSVARQFAIFKEANITGESSQAEKAISELTAEMERLSKQGFEPTEEQLIKLEARLFTAKGETVSFGKEIKSQAKGFKETGDQIAYLNSGLAGIRSGSLQGILQGFDQFSEGIQQLNSRSSGFFGKIGSALLVVAVVAIQVIQAVYDALSKKFGQFFAGLESSASVFGSFLFSVLTLNIEKAAQEFDSLGEAFDAGALSKKFEQIAEDAAAVAKIIEAGFVVPLAQAEGVLTRMVDDYKDQFAAVQSIQVAHQKTLTSQQTALEFGLESLKNARTVAVLAHDDNKIRELNTAIAAKELEIQTNIGAQVNNVTQSNIRGNAILQKQRENWKDIANAARDNTIAIDKYNQEFTGALETQVKLQNEIYELEIKKLEAERNVLLTQYIQTNSAEKQLAIDQKANEILIKQHELRLSFLTLLDRMKTELQAMYEVEIAGTEFIAANERDDFEARIAATQRLGDIKQLFLTAEIVALEDKERQEEKLGKKLSITEKARLENLKADRIRNDNETAEKTFALRQQQIEKEVELTLAGQKRITDLTANEIENRKQLADLEVERAINRLSKLNTGISATNIVTDLAGTTVRNKLVKDTSASFNEIINSAGELRKALNAAFNIRKEEIENNFNSTIQSIDTRLLGAKKHLADLLTQPIANQDETAIKSARSKIADIENERTTAKGRFSRDIAALTNDLNKNLLDVNQKAFDAQQRLISAYIQIGTAAVGIINTIFGAMKTASEAEVSLLDKSIDKQKERVDTIKEALKEGGDAARQYNLNVLQAEEDRQTELEKRRKEELEKQQIYTQAQLTLNALLAISNTIAEATKATGPLAPIVAAVNVGLILAQLAAGFAAARSQASSAIAEEGGHVEGLMSGKSHAQGGEWATVGGNSNKLLNFEGREYIFPKFITHNKGWLGDFENIRKYKLSPEEFAMKKIESAQLPQIKKEIARIVYISNDYGRLEQGISQLNRQMSELIKVMAPQKSFTRQIGK